MASGRRRQGMGGQDVNLSRKLVRILRHDAVDLGLRVQAGGFVDIDDLLGLSDMRTYDRSDIEAVVDSDRKSRYVLDRSSSRWRVKAAQGHSMQIPHQSESLTEITSAHQAPVVIHGTHLCNWNSIRKEGLKRMRRTHIHFAVGLPGDRNVVSGMPHNYQVAIYIDMKKVLQANPRIRFFRSENGVILTEGDAMGILEPKYFQKAIEKLSGRDLLHEDVDGRMRALQL